MKQRLNSASGGRISKPVAQRNVRENVSKNARIQSSPPSKRPVRNAPDQSQVLPKYATMESDACCVQQEQVLLPGNTPNACNQNTACENEILPPAPGALDENFSLNFLPQETESLTFLNEGNFMNIIDLEVDPDLLTLSELSRLLSDGNDECDLNLAPIPDIATDADMRLMANGLKYLESPALSFEQDDWRAHVIYDF